MSKAKGTTEKAPRPTKEELQSELDKAESEAIRLGWAVEKYTVRQALETFRGDMWRVEGFLRVTGDQIYDMAGSNDNPDQQLFLSLGNTLTLYADMMKQKIDETDPCYMNELPGGKA